MSHTKEGVLKFDLRNRSRVHTGFMSNMIHSGRNTIGQNPTQSQSQPQPQSQPQKTRQARPQFGSMFLRR